MALKILIHTFRMIFGNFGQALRVSVGPNLILMAFTFLTLGGIGLGSFDNGGMPAGQMPSGFGMLMGIFLLPLSLFVIAWVAVSWHRFILLEEYSGWLPAITGRPIWPYVGKSILLALLMLAVIIPVMFVFGGMISNSMSAAATDPNMPVRPTFWMTIMTSIMAIPISYVALRWGVALVGTALGQPMGFFEAWSKTAPVALVTLGVVVLLLGVNLVLNLILVILYPIPLLPDLWSIATSWLTMMLGISILTTLYGHVVEGRPLVTD